MFTLLKKKDKNYAKKRNNIQNTKYSFDENNNLYLTLPKLNNQKKCFNEIQSSEENNNKKKTSYDVMSEYVQTVENGDISNSSGDISSDCSGNNTESFSSDLNEEDRMKLYDKIRTKNNFMLTQIEEEKSPKFQKYFNNKINH